MQAASPNGGSLIARARALDAWLLARAWPVRWAVIVFTLALMVWTSLPNVPRPFIDYRQWPVLQHISQPATYGTDTIADMYEAKVVLNDPWDMYTKAKLAQTPLEAATWSKAASSPYPPAVLLAEAGLFWIGEHTGLGFYGTVLLLAALFLGLSLGYFLKTRWYLFPLLYANFSYLAYRFVFVQDGSYLVMLNVVMAALLLARAGRPLSHALMAVAIDMKITPLYYMKNVFAMSRGAAVVCVAILLAGLVLPCVVWKNYLYIFSFNDGLKSSGLGLLAAFGYGIPVAVALWYIETKLRFDWEDRVGWNIVPFAMFLAMKMNVPRHLLLALLVPDKRAWRNLAAAAALGLNALLPRLVPFGAVLSILTALVLLILGYYLHTIGWPQVWDDLRHPGRTARLLISSSPGAARV